MSSNTILLKCDGHREEYPASAALKPGHLVIVEAAGTVAKHATVGGRVPFIIACEDALQGKTIDDSFAANDIVPTVVCKKGDIVQVRLQSGQSATRGDELISGGDGTLTVGQPSTALPTGVLYRNVAASAAVTTTTTETLFDKSYTIPANSLRVGDILTVRAQAIATATNSTDTLTLKLYLGGLTGTAICTTGAIDVANGDIGYINATIVIRTIGASGTFVATGVQSLGVPGTVTAKPFLLGSTAIDTTATKVLGVSATWSTNNAGNSARLDVFEVENVRLGGGGGILAYAEETKDATSAEKLMRARVA